MRRTLVRTVTAGLIVLLGASAPRPAVHPLRVSPDRRHFVDARGAPFLYLADTAWRGFHRLTREEAERYIEDRAGKGFTVVHAVGLGLDGLRRPERPWRARVRREGPWPSQRGLLRPRRLYRRPGLRPGADGGELPTWDDVWHSRQNEPGPKVFDAAKAIEPGR